MDEDFFSVAMTMPFDAVSRSQQLPLFYITVRAADL